MNFLYLILFVVLTGCTHSLHQTNVSDFSPTFKAYNAGELIKVRSEQKVVLGFAENTNYVDSAHLSLKQKCPKGTVQGIVTNFYTSHGFFSWTNYVEIQALCVN
ncbi:MAG: hypothetical protein ACLGGX_11975 [Bdellovibrionia bacterium]